jgi:hypothetical protein
MCKRLKSIYVTFPGWDLEVQMGLTKLSGRMRGANITAQSMDGSFCLGADGIARELAAMEKRLPGHAGLLDSQLQQ